MTDRKTLAWKDTTSYGRNDKDSVPRTWELTTGGCRIVVTRSRHHDENQWILFVYGAMRLEDTVLESEKQDDALREALRLLSETAQAVVDGLPRFEKVDGG